MSRTFKDMGRVRDWKRRAIVGRQRARERSFFQRGPLAVRDLRRGRRKRSEESPSKRTEKENAT